MQIQPTWVRLVRLNFGLSLYSDHTLCLRLLLSLLLSRNFDVSAQCYSERHHFTFWLKFGLRPNFSSVRGLAKAKSKSEVTHCTELLRMPLPQTPHRHLTVFCVTLCRSPLIITLVLLRHVRGSEPYCHSIMFVCLSVCRSFRDVQPTTIDRSQPNLVGILPLMNLSSDPCKPFYARQHICYSAYMLWQFRLSVRLSHGWISQKWLKLGSRNFHHTVAPSL